MKTQSSELEDGRRVLTPGDDCYLNDDDYEPESTEEKMNVFNELSEIKKRIEKLYAFLGVVDDDDIREEPVTDSPRIDDL